MWAVANLSSLHAEENKLLYLLGKFNEDLARDCIQRARISNACELIPNPLGANWIKSNTSGNIIAYRFQLRDVSYFLLSHPISRFRGPRDYVIGGEETSFCAKLGLIPAYMVNLNKFTLLKPWGELAEKLFSRIADPIPGEEKVYWRLTPESNRCPVISSANFILRQNAEFHEYVGKYRTLFDDYFTFGFWSFPERGFSNSTIILNDSERVNTVIKASKSIYIPKDIYYKTMDFGREKGVEAKVLSLYGLCRGTSGYELRYQEDVVFTEGISSELEAEQKKGNVLINGIVSDFIRQSIWFPTLTEVELFEVSNNELFMSLIGIVIDERFSMRQEMASMGSVEDIKRETRKILDLLLKKSCLDETFADGILDQFSLAIDCLKPIVSIDQSELLYMHPAVFVALLENGLGDIIGKPEQLIATLRLLDKLESSSPKKTISTDETEFLKKSGHFPERVIPVLRKAIEEMHLSRLLKNPPYRACSNNSIAEESPSERNDDGSIKPRHSSDQVDIEEEKEQNFFRQVARLNRRTRDYERDSQ